MTYVVLVNEDEKLKSKHSFKMSLSFLQIVIPAKNKKIQQQ